VNRNHLDGTFSLEGEYEGGGEKAPQRGGKRRSGRRCFHFRLNNPLTSVANSGFSLRVYLSLQPINQYRKQQNGKTGKRDRRREGKGGEGTIAVIDRYIKAPGEPALFLSSMLAVSQALKGPYRPTVGRKRGKA